MFIPEEGHVFVGSDYSSQEPKILAELSQDPILVSTFVSGKDVYAVLASMAYGLPYEQCTKDTEEGKKRRNHGKVLQLALAYGMRAKSLSESLGISYDEAKVIYDKFVDNLHVAFDYSQMLTEQTKRVGYVKTMWGRKRRFPEMMLPEFEIFGGLDDDFEVIEVSQALKDKIIREIRSVWRFNDVEDKIVELESKHSVRIVDNRKTHNKYSTQILNSVIQGSAGDMTKIAMINVAFDPEMRRMGAKLALSVHDELIVDCPKEHAEEVKERLEYLMIEAGRQKVKTVPITSEGIIMERWIKD